MATLDHEDVQLLVSALRESICGQRESCHYRECPIDQIPAHSKQHEVLDSWIENNVRRQERRERIKEKVGGWMVISALGAIGTGVWHGFLYLREHLK